jgi:transposase
VLGVEAWTTIRYLQAQGVGIRAICRQLGVSRTAVRHALRRDGPPHYQRPVRANQSRRPHLAPASRDFDASGQSALGWAFARFRPPFSTRDRCVAKQC